MLYPKRFLDKKHSTPIREPSLKSLARLLADDAYYKIPELPTYPLHVDKAEFSNSLKHKELSGKSEERRQKPVRLPKINSKAKLIGNKYRGDVPPVGFYKYEDYWIKKTFSHKSIPLVLNPQQNVEPLISRSPSPKGKEILNKNKANQHFRAKNRSISPRKKGVWEEIKIQNTPEQITSILSFKSELKNIKDFQLSISRSLDKLREEMYLQR